MESIKGSQTEKNLLKAFAGESQARNRYTYFSKVAKKEGFEQIATLFLETAEEEKKHAKIFFSFLEGGDIEITATYPAGKIGTTIENLKAASAGENEEWTKIYPEFEKVAKDEGFLKVATAFKLISKVEAAHENRYIKLANNIQENTVFQKTNKTEWHCIECGYIHQGEKAPENCPLCAHPKAYFQVKAENY